MRARLATGAAALLLSLFALASLAALDRWSLTFDEITYAPAGYDYLTTGRIRFNSEKGPLAKALSALPLLALAPDAPRVLGDERGYRTGWDFFFRNRVPARRLAWWSRLPSIAAGAALAGLLFLWAREENGDGAALFALAFFLGDPLLAALSRLAIGDIFVALFLFAAFLLLKRSQRRALWLCGAAAGAAALSKFSGLLFFPAAALILSALRGPREAARTLLVPAGAAAACLLAAYHVDLPRLWEGFRSQSDIMRLGPAQSFFLGELGSGGFSRYYAVALFLKTPWPFLAAAAAGAALLARSKERAALVWIAIPFALLFLSASAGRSYATRYLFPAIPLLALLPAAAWKLGGARLRAVLAALLLWQLADAAWTYPHALSYLNPPWRGSGQDYLANSDFDWGQDLPDLARIWEEEGRPPLTLCYFGTAEPAAYGLEAQELTTTPGLPVSERVLPPAPARELLAVSAGCRQFMGLGPPGGKRQEAWAWLKRRKPARMAGETIFVYDTTRDAEAHGRVGSLHYFQGDFRKALREAGRVLEIEPGSEDGMKLLGDVSVRLSD